MEITQDMLKKHVEKGTTLLAFHCEKWCGSSRALVDTIDLLAKLYQCIPLSVNETLLDKTTRVSEDLNLKLTFLDADIHENLAKHFKIRCVPTLFLFEQGAQVAVREGLGVPKVIQNFIDQI